MVIRLESMSFGDLKQYTEELEAIIIDLATGGVLDGDELPPRLTQEFEESY